MFPGSNARALGLSRTSIAAALLVFSWATSAPGVMAAGLFSGLAGSWRGEGSIAWTTGETERIRCTATYEVEKDGNQLIQNLNCATDSTKLTVKSDITFNSKAGSITGTWTETNYGIAGVVSGSASTGKIQAIVKSTDKRFTARVNVVTKGSDQTVTIMPEGLDVTNVSVALKRKT